MKARSIPRRSLVAPAPDHGGHICSLVVHARPGTLVNVLSDLRRLAGVDVHGHNEAGKIVVTVESENDDALVRTMGAISELPGVLSSALVYQHAETTPRF